MICVKCKGRICRRARPNRGNHLYVLIWQYTKNREELNVEVTRVDRIENREKAVVTHINCKRPQIPGFVERVKKKLGMPQDAEHPLLMEESDAQVCVSEVSC